MAPWLRDGTLEGCVHVGVVWSCSQAFLWDWAQMKLPNRELQAAGAQLQQTRDALEEASWKTQCAEKCGVGQFCGS